MTDLVLLASSAMTVTKLVFPTASGATEQRENATIVKMDSMGTCVSQTVPQRVCMTVTKMESALDVSKNILVLSASTYVPKTVPSVVVVIKVLALMDV